MNLPRAFFVGLLALICTLVLAVDISMIGLFPSKAVVVPDHSPAKVVSSETMIEPVIRLMSTEGNGATFDLNGKHYNQDSTSVCAGCRFANHSTSTMPTTK